MLKKLSSKVGKRRNLARKPRASASVLKEGEPTRAVLESRQSDPAPYHYLRVDDQGRIIPPTAAELEAKVAAVRRMTEKVRSIPDEPGEDDRDFFRTIDAERPWRPLFEGLY